MSFRVLDCSVLAPSRVQSRSKAYLSTVVFAIACLVPGLASAQPTHISVGMGGADPNGPSEAPSVSDDGRFVAFASDAGNLVPNDTNGFRDVFVRDRQANTTTRVSVATGGGQATGASSMAQISANGRFVVFASAASLVPDDTHTCDSVPDLVANDTNGLPDTFLHDRLTGATTRVSLSTDGSQLEFGSVLPARISTDGSMIVYTAVLDAANRPDPETCAGETRCGAIWLLERETNARTLLSLVLPKDTAGDGFGNPHQRALAISRDGRFLLIECRCKRTAA